MILQRRAIQERCVAQCYDEVRNSREAWFITRAALLQRESCYFTRMETSAVRPRESRAVMVWRPTASGQWNGASLDERPASTPSTDQ